MRRRHWLHLCAAWPLGAHAAAAPMPSPHPLSRSRPRPHPAAGADLGELAAAWDLYAQRFVSAEGRAIDTGNQGITHTEGLGVSMLVAQACGDRARFDKLHRFSAQLRREDGLFSWRWEPGKGVTDPNNATDGDLYIAWALARAGRRWNERRYLEAAAAQARAVRTLLAVQVRGQTLLLPGKDGFWDKPAGAEAPIPVVNPSYLILPAFAELGQVDASPAWAALLQSALQLLSTARFGSHQLPADWLWMGEPVKPWAQRPARFGYEAVRSALFLAWLRQARHPALLAIARFMQAKGFPAWVDLQTGEVAPYAAPAGFESVAALVRARVFGMPPRFEPIDTDYYSSSLSLLARLAWQDGRSA